MFLFCFFFFFQAEDGIRDLYVTGVQTCALPIWPLTVACTATWPRDGSCLLALSGSRAMAEPSMVYRVASKRTAEADLTGLTGAILPLLRPGSQGRPSRLTQHGPCMRRRIISCPRQGRPVLRVEVGAQ